MTITQEFLRVVFVVGFCLQVLLGAWAIVQITRMRRQQAITLAILNALAARAGLQRDTDKIETGAVPQSARDVSAAPTPPAVAVIINPEAATRRRWFARIVGNDRRNP